jgi:hypothetical protein
LGFWRTIHNIHPVFSQYLLYDNTGYRPYLSPVPALRKAVSPAVPEIGVFIKQGFYVLHVLNP